MSASVLVQLGDTLATLAERNETCKKVLKKVGRGSIISLEEVYIMAEILEIIMIVSFGASWPLNVIKSYKARTAKGKSLWFLVLIVFGYIAGIASKFMNEAYMAEFSQKWYVLFFYCLNLFMVSIDLCLYFRNKALDKKNS